MPVESEPSQAKAKNARLGPAVAASAVAALAEGRALAAGPAAAAAEGIHAALHHAVVHVVRRLWGWGWGCLT